MSQASSLKTAQQVASYYDRNTLRFLRFGGSGETAAIHRQIWAPGVETAQQAFEYLNQLVSEAVQPCLHQRAPASEDVPVNLQASPRLHASARLLDLGCGVGGTATWLAERLGLSVVGVTNSTIGQSQAIERARRLGLEERCRFVLADFMALPALGLFQAAYAIESFVHAQKAARFFEQVNRQLMPGGRLVLCDDFLAATMEQPGESARRWLERFQNDWRINTLVTLEAAGELARNSGFRLVEAVDLSAYLRSFHPLVLRAVSWLTRLPARSAYWQNLSGGTALQVCVSHGWTRYLALTFEKEAECTP
jgi:ubiquinone/menaquinone biosynthesis C-methylase UbiE